MDSGVNRTAKVTDPIPVVVLYTTAMVDTDGDGSGCGGCNLTQKRIRIR
jgi:hypothetical protein